MKRLVLDPNALASGIVDPHSDRPPRLLFEALENLAFEVVVCPKLLAELRKALRKPYFREKLIAEEARKAVKRIEVVAVTLDDPTGIEPTLRDPKDDYLLALGRQAGAEAIVTGDKDLLDHKEQLDPPALNLREACELLELID